MSAGAGPRVAASWRGARGRRRLAAALALALAAGALLWLGVWQLRRSQAERRAWPVTRGSLALPGLAERAVVSRDARGVPHVEAASEVDALRALGFVHAQDRLGQMLWLRRAARGRTAEVLGREGVEADRRVRLLGIGHHADAAARELAPAERRLLEAYAGGVNARMDRIRAGRAAPPRIPNGLDPGGADEPPWTPADCLAVLKLHAWSLGGALDTSLVLDDLVQHLGGREARPFFPAEAGIRAVPYGTEARRPPPGTPGAPAGGPGDPLRRVAGLSGPGLGSGAWVVGGRHTASGRPLLAADLHAEARVPGSFHEVHLSAPPLEVAGATLPGVPVFWAGRNRHVAWAAVHARAVVTDLYLETLHPDDPDRYHDGRGWEAFARRSETIAVRGAPDVTLEVRSTAHGPLVDPLLEGPRDPLSLAWTGARTGPGVAGLMRVARAADAAGVRRALRAHPEPVVAVVYADDQGAAGVQVAGWLPRRGLPSGLLPVPGRADWYGWRSPVPPEQLPGRALADGEGWLVAADNRLPEAGDAGIEWLWRTGERAARIDDLLGRHARRGELDVGDLAATQRDLRSGRARQVVEQALALAARGPALDGGAAEVASRLRDWDGFSEAGSPGAALYHVFLQELLRRLLVQRLDPALADRYLALPHPNPVEVAAGILSASTGAEVRVPGWDDPDRLADAVRESLRAAWLHMSVEVGPNRDKWTWGRLHPLVFRPLVEGRGASVGPFALGGDALAVATAAYDRSDPFGARVVAGYRFATDLAEAGYALSALVPGPSEHPGHPHRASGVGRWLEGRPGLLVMSPLLVEEAAVERLVLEPGS